jgi:hypothetical protein
MLDEERWREAMVMSIGARLVLGGAARCGQKAAGASRHDDAAGCNLCRWWLWSRDGCAQSCELAVMADSWGSLAGKVDATAARADRRQGQE